LITLTEQNKLKVSALNDPVLFPNETTYLVSNGKILNISSIANRIDFDMGLFGRSKYRQFLFAFAGTLNEKSELKYLETEIVEEYNNTKMR